MTSRPDIWMRVQADIDAGDLVMARRRLVSWIGNEGPDDEVAIRIGSLSLQLGNQVNAGRWWFLTSATGAEVDDAVRAFVEWAGTPYWVPCHLPKPLRRGRSWDDLPAPAQARFESLQLGKRGWPAAAGDERAFGRPGALADFVGLLIVAVCVLVFGVGVVTVLGWIF